MDFFGFILGLLAGTCVGCGLMALLSAGVIEDREVAAHRDGEAQGYRKAVTDFGQLGDR